jgi:hypothetical protein
MSDISLKFYDKEGKGCCYCIRCPQSQGVSKAIEGHRAKGACPRRAQVAFVQRSIGVLFATKIGLYLAAG